VADEAEGWGEQGAKSCAHWFTWRIGLDPATAREKVRVARALGGLRKIDEALAAGRLSYAKVRALTRFTTPDNEENALMMAMAATGAQLERICQRLRRASDSEREMVGTRQFRARPVGDGFVRLEIVLSADEADLVVHAVERARQRGADPAAPPRPTAADGLMNVVSSYLAGRGAERDGTSAPAGQVGRRTRAIPTAIRRALWIRDKGCRFPGCTSTRFLHGHHVQHWLHGGRTSLDNLLFLCSFHHRLVHEGGFSVSLDDAAVVVTAPTGRRVSAETSDAATVEWPTLDWTGREPAVMPIPTWDGGSVDYDSAVDALWPTYGRPASCSTPAI
jgi:Domain of unknown function (DUF222)/HNH endonuclease